MSSPDDLIAQNWQPSPDVFANAVGDETVLLHIKDGIYFGLDAVGSIIWKGLNVGQPVAEICVEIAEEFDVPVGQVEADARAFLEQLEANNIVHAAA